VPDSSKYGLMAEFLGPHELLTAARRAYAEGYRKMDAHSPESVEGLAEAIGFRRTRVPLIVLLGGLSGCFGALFMQSYSAAVSYPLNVGGRPYNSWPSFIPITFELTVLGAALAGVIGMLALNGLPQPFHPLFNVPEFSRASRNGYFLSIESADPHFDPERTRSFLEALRPSSVYEVPR
jgi:hypothetical protein